MVEQKSVTQLPWFKKNLMQSNRERLLNLQHLTKKKSIKTVKRFDELKWNKQFVFCK